MVARADIPTIAVDFDLTLVNAELMPLPNAREAMQHLKQTGWQVIVWTGQPNIQLVREILDGHAIPFDYINENPHVDSGEHSRKIHFHAAIDDKAIPFNGDWPSVLEEADRRRKELQLMRPQTVRVWALDANGQPQILAHVGLDARGAAKSLGPQNPLIDEIFRGGVEAPSGTMFPHDGIAFLRALLELQGTYLWADIDN